MCTVTYIPVRDGFFLGSNRDEQQNRGAAMEPRVYMGRTGSLLFPKDTRAGGTWFAAHAKGPVAVLLNGAFEKHEPRPPYRRSRGLVLLDLIDQEDPLQAFFSMDLEHIEPFTFVLAAEGRLLVCRWDGAARSHHWPDPTQPHIWSSVTLYTPEVIAKREQWFGAWLREHPAPSMDEVLGFHQEGGEGDAHNGIRMNRDGQMLTVSITLFDSCSGSIRYLDVPTGKFFSRSFLTPSPSL